MPSAGVYKPQEVGNASLLMKRVPFSLRFERDRGQVSIDIGARGSCTLPSDVMPNDLVLDEQHHIDPSLYDDAGAQPR